MVNGACENALWIRLLGEGWDLKTVVFVGKLWTNKAFLQIASDLDRCHWTIFGHEQYSV